MLCLHPVGTLPPSWGALARLQVLYASRNQLTGPLPSTWSEMVALGSLEVSNNALTGTVPPSWGNWPRVKLVVLFANPQLSGCLPPAWEGTVNTNRTVKAGIYKGKDPLTAGTNITGYC